MKVEMKAAIAEKPNANCTVISQKVLEECINAMNKNNRKEHYNKKGMYAGYDKNHKERDALDYYSTPIEEVTNILNVLGIDFSHETILEPCAGGGHMLQGIWNYIFNNCEKVNIIASDIQERETIFENCNYASFATGKEYDFLSDEYPFVDNIDYVIMNPPYAVIEPFTMKALGIANKGVLMLGRLQFLEGEKRYLNILKDFPPSDVYVYVDRISCYKNGNDKEKMASAQAYAWFYWDLKQAIKDTKVHWIRRADKAE